MQPAHEDEPTDKPIIERTLGSVHPLFAQYVTSLGSLRAGDYAQVDPTVTRLLT
jgi:hypothetical protein